MLIRVLLIIERPREVPQQPRPQAQGQVKSLQLIHLPSSSGHKPHRRQEDGPQHRHRSKQDGPQLRHLPQSSQGGLQQHQRGGRPLAPQALRQALPQEVGRHQLRQSQLLLPKDLEE